MRFLFCASNDPDERALIASVNDCGALILMRKQFFIGDYLCAALVRMTAFKHNFTEQVPCHSIDPIELTFISTEWTGVGVLLKPMSLAIAA